MTGDIKVSKNAFKNFKNVCEDRFNGTYEIKEAYQLGYVITITFSDIQDVFSLGQILESEKWIERDRPIKNICNKGLNPPELCWPNRRTFGVQCVKCKKRI